MTFEQAEDVLEKVGQMPSSYPTVWRQSSTGEQAQPGAGRATASGGRPLVPGEPQTARVKGVAMDGAIVYIRHKGELESKDGSVFEVEAQPTRDRETEEVVDRAKAVDNIYVAYLGDPEVFRQLV